MAQVQSQLESGIAPEAVKLDTRQKSLYDECCVEFAGGPPSGLRRQTFFHKLITRFKTERVIQRTRQALGEGKHKEKTRQPACRIKELARRAM